MKRSIDLVIAVAAFIILFPFFIILWAAIVVKLGAPAFFIQERAGLHGTPFMLYKFRTMTSEKDDEGNLLPDEERMTRFGHMLRSLSLDELPQLINIIKGDMSLIGPRPLLSEYLPFYTKEQMKRHQVRPGMTGWAQVNGRNQLSWEQKFELDVWYVKHRNLLIDLKIIWLTVLRVAGRDGICQEGYATVEKFTRAGNEVAK
ncbi:sugar transferase [Jeotgalibacillus aurantiacus]|uniref:sugar transferase n=1 Tax=Jeotgalibacillus aurantiacus TaxID=2763266 RepID=UPI001D0B9EF2|nr:sugar transferase [Jeotgalibacillus aurantiacus]